MTSESDLMTSEFETTPLEQETPAPLDPAIPGLPESKPVQRSAASQVSRGIAYFLVFVLGFAIYSVVGKWACEEANESATVADWCLWVSGSDLTWEEYQKKQVASGNPRLKDKKMGWVGQLLQDAYAGNHIDDGRKKKRAGRRRNRN